MVIVSILFLITIYILDLFHKSKNDLLAAAIVISVATGGIGLVVIGACAVLGGLGGGIIGGKIGETIGNGADRSINWMID